MKDKPVKEKKLKKKSTGERLDNLERYLKGQAPHLEAYDPLKEYPEIEPLPSPDLTSQSIPKTELS